MRKMRMTTKKKKETEKKETEKEKRKKEKSKSNEQFFGAYQAIRLRGIETGTYFVALLGLFSSFF